MAHRTEPASAGDPAPPLPPEAARLLAQAREQWNRQRFDAAGQLLSRVLALAPDDPVALKMFGMAVQRRGDHARAVDCLRRALPAWPDDAGLHTSLGLSLFSLGEAGEAVQHLQRACELDPASASVWFNLGEAWWRQLRAQEAIAPLQRALEREPSHSAARLSLARALSSLGRIPEAAEAFREVVRRDPLQADGWYGLSLNAAHFDAADTAQLRQAFARTDLPPRTHYLLGFTLARALEDQGDYAQAFDILQQANASQRAHAEVRWEAAKEHQFVEAVADAFADHAVPAVDTERGREVLFVVGMPRSGSTLVEHILASHREVEGANEIRALTDVIQGESQRRGMRFLSWAADTDAQGWQRLGEQYLARTARWRSTKPRCTDKNLTNWHFVGAALAMLPAARVIVVRRDPVENCLACYRHCFNEEVGFACSLEDTADYCADFLRLTRFWLRQYPQRVFDLEYEALVSDPEPVIRRLLDFCELPFDPACLAPHQTARVVLTPSAAQVREPLHDGTARSARYGDKLAPLRQRLRAAGVLQA